METKTKTFDAVAESRKWREATSLKLNAMSREERLKHLSEVHARYVVESAERKAQRELKMASSS
jgi:hypothetical protein